MNNQIIQNSTVKNSIAEESDIPQDLDLLNRWSIPKINPRTIYKFGIFDKLSFTQVVKTTEETIPLHNSEVTLRLLTEKDLTKYRINHKFIHIGLVQVAFKPLTLEGLPESFIAALRDGRNLNWKQSLMGIIQSSLTHGAVYFNVYPNLQLSLSDINILDALTLNVKMHGYNYSSGSEVIAICYRVYYKPLFTLNPQCRIVDKPMNETILIESNFSKSEITTRRAIKWDEIIFPENWIIEQAVPAIPITQNNPTQIIQNSEGQVQIQFDRRQRYLEINSRPSTSTSHRHYISPIDHMVKSPSRHSTSRLREIGSEQEPIDSLRFNNDNIIQGLYRPTNNHILEVPTEAHTSSEMNFSI